MMMPAVWCAASVLPGSAEKSGSSESATFMRNVPEPERQCVDAPQEFRRQRRRIDEPREEQLRIEIGDDDFGARKISPASVTTPTARPFSTITSRTAAIGADVDAARSAALRHRLGDRAHAADRMAPDALLAVHLAEDVVEEHIGGALRIGALIGADDAVEAEHRLDRIALEPGIEEVAGRLEHQVEEVACAPLHRASRAGGRAARPSEAPGGRASPRRAHWAASRGRARAARRRRGRAAPNIRRAAPRPSRRISPPPTWCGRRRR